MRGHGVGEGAGRGILRVGSRSRRPCRRRCARSGGSGRLVSTTRSIATVDWPTSTIRASGDEDASCTGEVERDARRRSTVIVGARCGRPGRARRCARAARRARSSRRTAPRRPRAPSRAAGHLRRGDERSRVSVRPAPPGPHAERDQRRRDRDHDQKRTLAGHARTPGFSSSVPSATVGRPGVQRPAHLARQLAPEVGRVRAASVQVVVRERAAGRGVVEGERMPAAPARAACRARRAGRCARASRDMTRATSAQVEQSGVDHRRAARRAARSRAPPCRSRRPATRTPWPRRDAGRGRSRRCRSCRRRGPRAPPDVLLAAQRRVDLEPGVVAACELVGQQEVVRASLRR